MNEDLMHSLQKSVADNLGDYVVKEWLNRGATGYVFRIETRKSNKSYALKVIHKKSNTKQEQQVLKRIKKQIDIHRNLKNRFIVRLQNTFSDADNYYIVLQYCEYGDLSKMIINEYPHGMMMSEIKCIGLQIAKGLHYLHKNHIYHSDLKIDNIFLSKQKQVKIGDFGLSVVIKNGQKIRDTKGTMGYLAPQIILPHGLQADIWAYGCILYFMATGKLPFQLHSLKELATKVTEKTVTEIQYGNLSPQLANLLQNIFIIDVVERIDIKGILQHPFFTGQNLPIQSNQIQVKEENKQINVKDTTALRRKRINTKKYEKNQNQIKVIQNMKTISNQNSRIKPQKTCNLISPIDTLKVQNRNYCLNSTKYRNKDNIKPFNIEGMMVKPMKFGKIIIRIDEKGLTRQQENNYEGLKINISANGNQITISKDLKQKSFNLSKLPIKYEKYYEDCRKMIQLIKNQTIRCQIQLNFHRLILMWSGTMIANINDKQYIIDSKEKIQKQSLSIQMKLEKYQKLLNQAISI